MDILEKARVLGTEIQSSDIYKDYAKAKQQNDDDKALQSAIEQFNLLRLELNKETYKPEKDADKIADVNKQLQASYTDIMANPNMDAFNDAKQDLEKMLNQVTAVLRAAANGDDPLTFDVDASCGPDGCAGCSGCS